MKQIRILATWLAACAVAFATASNATAQSSKERVGTVTKMKGAARVSTGNNIWRPLKVGDQLKPGMIVQTAGNSFVDIVFGDAGAAASGSSVTPVKAGAGAGGAGSGPGGGKTAVQQDVIRLTADSVLAIDKLSSMQTGADKVTETELDLRSGKVFGSVKKQSAASRFEVKIPNGVAGIRGTVFSITVEGVVSALDGDVIIAWEAKNADGTTETRTQTVPHGHRFDIRTPNVPPTPIPEAERQAMLEVARAGATGTYVDTMAEYIFDRTIYYVSPAVGSSTPGK
jgi:hypothetical protein